MFVVKHKNFFFFLSAVLLLVASYGFLSISERLSIDFTGGTLLELRFSGGSHDLESIRSAIGKAGITSATIGKLEGGLVSIKSKPVSEEQKSQLVENLGGQTRVSLERFTTIGPVVGKELGKKSIIALMVVILGIVAFITFAFRKVSRPVPSWMYGLSAVIALIHDIIIPAGAFLLIAPYIHGEIDLLFVTALLAILGYSVHDTIVVFDRIRENLRRLYEARQQKDFEMVVGESISETFVRSINTSVTIFLVLVALYFFGSAATKNFVLLLIFGIIAGTYSSIFIASPFLVLLEKMRRRS